MYKKIIEKLKDKNIAILGFGREGKSTYKFIRKYLNIDLTIIDKKDFSNELNDNKATFIYGDDHLANLDKYDLVIKTPGISLKEIDTTNINITSELELILEVARDNIIGITGTKGKSTTTSLIYEIIKKQKDNTFLMGNIGVPIFDSIEEYNDGSILVIEMSSHQLEFVKYSPHIGIILNLYEDHLDHAGTIKHYHECKLNIWKYQNSNDIAIYNIDNNYLCNYIKSNNYKASFYGVSINNKENNKYYIDNNYLYSNTEQRNLVGDYNLFNIIVALNVAYLLKFDLRLAREVVNNFKPLEYRLFEVGRVHNISFYSDTLATIPSATIEGINTLGNVNTLILGGQDRGIDYNGLISYLNSSDVENIICMPSTGKKIGESLNNKNVYYEDTLESATSLAKKITKKNTICLLSPAAPSYDYFKNYKEKADKYMEYVNRKEEV